MINIFRTIATIIGDFFTQLGYERYIIVTGITSDNHRYYYVGIPTGKDIVWVTAQDNYYTPNIESAFPFSDKRVALAQGIRLMHRSEEW